MYYDDYNRRQEYEVIDYAPRAKAKTKRMNPAAIVALCLVFALIGGAIGAVTIGVYQSSSGGTTTIYQGDRLADEVKTVSVDTRTQLTLPQLYANCVSSTVGISVDYVTTNYFGQSIAAAAAGSGFVITEDGYIVTNYHVVYNESDDKIADKIKVTFLDGSVHEARYIGGEQDNDIAVLKIEAKGLTPVVLGKSANMNVGETVAAIGNPLGELTFSMTDGIISALERSITTSDGTVMNMMQTNTAINPGNSGGALFNMYGEVIGITTSKYLTTNDGTSVEGLGFIIPIDDVVELIADIMEHGYVTGKPYLGIIVSTLTEYESTRYSLPVGASVLGVVEEGCAGKAGLQAGDIITAANGQEIQGHTQLIEIKNALRAGERMDLTVYRSGEVLNLSIVLDESTPALEAASSALRDEINAQQNQSNSSNSYNGGNYSNWPFGNIW